MTLCLFCCYLVLFLKMSFNSEIKSSRSYFFKHKLDFNSS